MNYRKNIVNDIRIAKGRKLLREHADILNKVSEKYDVQPQYIVALWGIETNFGGFTGGYDVVNALAQIMTSTAERGPYCSIEPVYTTTVG